MDYYPLLVQGFGNEERISAVEMKTKRGNKVSSLTWSEWQKENTFPLLFSVIEKVDIFDNMKQVLQIHT